MAAVHPELYARALAGMSEGIAPEQFRAASGIAGKSVAQDVIDFMLARNIGRIEGGTLSFSALDRLEMATLAIKSGCDLERVAERLSWKDFEKLASEVLGSLGYKTANNVRFTEPRMEIDVLGVDGALAIAVDCKHWKRSSPSALSHHCKKQLARTEELLRRNPAIEQAVPAILTLHAEGISLAGGVPVVPVLKFRSFVMDMPGFMHGLSVVRQGPA